MSDRSRAANVWGRMNAKAGGQQDKHNAMSSLHPGQRQGMAVVVSGMQFIQCRSYFTVVRLLARCLLL